MQNRIPFVKASGAGNDFVVLNNLDGRLAMEKGPLARALCDRHQGIGADGLLLLEPSRIADFRMLYFNADGSTGGMCGNGGRCVARVAHLSGIVERQCRFEALDFVYAADIGDATIRLSMKVPEGIRGDIVALAGGREISCHAVDTGAPHAVVFVDDLENLDVVSIGRSLRYAPAFQPEGTNVNFARLAGGNAIGIRTYERGVENETLACGTGSIAAAVISVLLHNLQFPIDVRVRSGATLRVHARRSEMSVTDVVLEGPADIRFQGNVLYDSAREAVAEEPQPLLWGEDPGGP